MAARDQKARSVIVSYDPRPIAKLVAKTPGMANILLFHLTLCDFVHEKVTDHLTVAWSSLDRFRPKRAVVSGHPPPKTDDFLSISKSP